MKNTTAFIMDKFVCKNFFNNVSTEYKLIEEEGGKSEIDWVCNNKINRCISNFDKKDTNFSFLESDSRFHLNKRVDHVVFELNQNEKWDVHLIEMKTGVETQEKWIKIKGKFRASYLTVKAIAAILDIETENFYFYTTYEHASFMNKKENTITRKAPIGKKTIRPEDEWNGNKFGLEIGDRLPFKHTPIEMKRNDKGDLIKKGR